MQIEQIRLKNKLETLFINSPGASAATAQIWFRAGSALEKGDDLGIAHFLEHMFFKGTKKRPGAQIAHEVESFGGEINAFTSFDYTCYYINTPSNQIETTVEILLDMVSNPQFLNQELIPERDVVFEEYRRSIDNPSQFSFKKLQNQAFTSGYAHPILGNEKTIKNFSREQLIRFRKQNYNLANCMLVIAGDLSKKKDKITKLINQFKIPAGQASQFPKFNLKKTSSINVHHKDVRQCMLTMAIKAQNYEHEQAAAEDLAINCLAHGETSRLYKNLVNNDSIATSISGSTMYFNDGGVHFLRVTFPYENFKLVKKFFLETITSLEKEEFKTNEIEKIKNQYVASKVYEKESLEAFAFSLGHGFAQNGNIHCEDEFIQRLKKAQTNQVNQAIKDIFKRPIHFNLQVPKDIDLKECKEILTDWQKNIKPSKTAISKTEKSGLISKFDSNVELINLKPNIDLIYRQNKMTPTFVLHAYMKGGQMNESDKNAGLYHLLSRSITYGHQLTRYEEMKEQLEYYSASLNGFSGKNAYGLITHGQSEHFDDLMKHFMQTLLHPQIPEKYLNQEKEFIYRALENHKEDPVKQCFKKFNQFIFNQHHYALDMIGNEKTIKSFTRENLLKEHEKCLSNSNLIFTYCGDLDKETVIKQLNQYLVTLKSSKKINKKTNLKQTKPILGQTEYVPFNREQTHIFIGTNALRFIDKEEAYLKMFTTYLSGQSSELFIEIRDKKGLCYTVQPVHHAALEAGYWGIYIGTGNEKTSKAIEAIEDLIKKYAKLGLSKAEFNRVKKMISGQNLINVQTNDDHANLYSIACLHGLDLDHQHHMNNFIKNANHDDFQKFIKKFLNQAWNKIVVGEMG
jgi:zinc protease